MVGHNVKVGLQNFLNANQSKCIAQISRFQNVIMFPFHHWNQSLHLLFTICIKTHLGSKSSPLAYSYPSNQIRKQYWTLSTFIVLQIQHHHWLELVSLKSWIWIQPLHAFFWFHNFTLWHQILKIELHLTTPSPLRDSDLATQTCWI